MPKGMHLVLGLTSLNTSRKKKPKITKKSNSSEAKKSSVGKKAGEGVFGISFKIKGSPKDLQTSVNPIKTLTPRFITRTLEKIKKN